MQPRIFLIRFKGTGDRRKPQILGKWKWVWWVWQRDWNRWLGAEKRRESERKLFERRSIAIAGKWKNCERENFIEKMENWKNEKEKENKVTAIWWNTSSEKWKKWLKEEEARFPMVFKPSKIRYMKSRADVTWWVYFLVLYLYTLKRRKIIID